MSGERCKNIDREKDWRRVRAWEVPRGVLVVFILPSTEVLYGWRVWGLLRFRRLWPTADRSSYTVGTGYTTGGRKVKQINLSRWPKSIKRDQGVSSGRGSIEVKEVGVVTAPGCGLGAGLKEARHLGMRRRD
ncbi:hypothetical protein K432DRAFT_62980 [Lepidopterella palustris CBS 459.81]|uniref:Uncharacterized protein n=1 Tax=Lepidopterella palustris CBS 459.81 TaxID=1314670 RepID=A0A8E2E8V9_9PEZI|nr:hypothetical protein K432DRAFT_62980 [Lepidopterella palustris CBS 459.81]